MTKSQLGSDQRQSSANERHRSRSQPTSKRRGDTEDLRYPDVPMKQLQMFFRKGRPIKRDSCPTVKLVKKHLMFLNLFVCLINNNECQYVSEIGCDTNPQAAQRPWPLSAPNRAQHPETP